MNERIRSFDIAKGIGILLVVLGHAVVSPLRQSGPAYQAVYDAVYFFHMSYFFFISGMLFEMTVQRRSRSGRARWQAEIVRGKAKALMIPYLFYCIAGYAGIALFCLHPGVRGIAQAAGFSVSRNLTEILKEILTTEQLMFHHLWFLYTLFFVSCISLFVKERQEKAVLLGAAVGSCILSALPQTPLIVLYIVRYLLFFQIGRRFLRGGGQERKLSGKQAAVMCAAFVLAEILYVTVFAAPGIAGGIRYAAERCACALLIILGGVLSSVLLFRVSEKLGKGNKGRFLELAGKNSMEIYVLHMPFLVTGTGQILYRLGVSGPVMIVICMACGTILPLLLGPLLKKSGILSLLLFGRSKR